MKSKICGISDSKTLKFLTDHTASPEFIGFIVNYPKSKRYVKIKKLHQMDESLEQVPKYGPIPNLKLTLKDIAVGDFVFHVPNN